MPMMGITTNMIVEEAMGELRGDTLMGMTVDDEKTSVVEDILTETMIIVEKIQVKTRAL